MTNAYDNIVRVAEAAGQTWLLGHLKKHPVFVLSEAQVQRLHEEGTGEIEQVGGAQDARALWEDRHPHPFDAYTIQVTGRAALIHFGWASDQLTNRLCILKTHNQRVCVIGAIGKGDNKDVRLLVDGPSGWQIEHSALGLRSDEGDHSFAELLSQSCEFLIGFLARYHQEKSWVVEETPASARVIRQVKKGKKSPRLVQRDRLLILSQDEMLRRIYSGQHTGTSVASHIRRGHWRRYQHERFSEERRAKPQWVDAHWVGPEEGVSAGVRYRVRLDL